jgi:hypothetical protein
MHGRGGRGIVGDGGRGEGRGIVGNRTVAQAWYLFIFNFYYILHQKFTLNHKV